MEKKDKALVPVPKTEEPPCTPIEEDYQQAKTYFKESMVQAARTNVALITVLGVFVLRGARYAWEALRRYLPGQRGDR
ncbi:MAG: hypothetical protein EOL86_13945 [Deltaproteobacteria bacterium]|nr:hypothetical protein [Deltaproteobacteria bacterium]